MHYIGGLVKAKKIMKKTTLDKTDCVHVCMHMIMCVYHTYRCNRVFVYDVKHTGYSH